MNDWALALDAIVRDFVSDNPDESLRQVSNLADRLLDAFPDLEELANTSMGVKMSWESFYVYVDSTELIVGRHTSNWRRRWRSSELDEVIEYMEANPLPPKRLPKASAPFAASS